MRLGRDPAIGRLTVRPEFLAAADRGRRFHTPRLSLQGRRRAPEEAGDGLRVGFTVTKRVGHATERNRIRRRLRRALTEGAGPAAAEPIDLVVIGRRDAFAAPFSSLVDDIARGLAVLTGPERPRGGSRRHPPSAQPITEP